MHLLSRRTLLARLAIGVMMLVPVSTAYAQSEAVVGDRAPQFTLEDTEGDTHRLADYEGQYVVLEWTNFRCPYVGKHYGSGNMQQLQETYTNEGVVWLSIYSFPPSHPAYMSPDEMAAQNEELGGRQTALLLDPTGEVGQTYGATNTPHMFVINPDGTLLYKGGIDDKPTTDEADLKSATNYVRAALEEARSGSEVSVESAAPYGCPIQYAD